MLDDNLIKFLLRDEVEGYENGYNSADIIQNNSGNDLKYYHICGANLMTKAIEGHL